MNQQTSNLKTLSAIAVCIIFVVIGIALREEHKVMAYLSIGFWGLGIIFLTIQLITNIRSKYFPKEIKVNFPESIDIKQCDPSDEEIVEEWFRDFAKCSDQYEYLHGVSAYRVDDKEFPWYVYFSAGSEIREEPFASKLYKVVYDAILKVEGVAEAFHEDREKFVVTGSPRGYDLIYSVSAAIDEYMIAHEWDWLKQDTITT